jgi:hypothetical protein
MSDVGGELSPKDEERLAFDRLARTYDGVLIHRYLRRVLESCRAVEDGGTLQRHEGARILARDLMAHMAAGIEGTVDRADNAILRSSGKPVGGHAPRGIRRRVAVDPNVERFLSEPDAADQA